jgi:hypothetical protein
MRTDRALLMLVAATLAGGCLHKASAELAPTKQFSRPPKAAVDIEVYFAGQQPVSRFEDVGLVNGSRRSETIEQTIDAMKQIAAARGLDGIREVACAAPWEVSAGNCHAKGFVYVP